MDIYWIKDKQRCGPATVPDVISRLQMNELTPDTLGWHAGCSAWRPLRELPALADFLNPDAAAPAAEEAPATPGETASPAAAAEESQSTAYEAPAAPEAEAAPPRSDDTPQGAYTAMRVYLPSPVARLLARLVDYSLYTVLFYGALYLRDVPYDARLLLSVNPLLWLPMVLIEATLLSTWGTTPGKALMGIRVTTFGDVPRLSFVRAVMRSLMVFILGTGVMMPQLLPIMLAFEYWMLRRRGITPWDARCSTLPTQQQPALPSRYVLAVITLYTAGVVAASCMQPWFNDMVADIERSNPGLAQTLRQYLPETKPEPPQPAAEPLLQLPEPAFRTAPGAAPPAAPAPMDTSLPGI